MKFGLEDKVIKKILEIFQKNNTINEVIIFGSRATGKFKSGSDIDLAFKNSQLDFHSLNFIRNQLDELNLPYMFDLCVFENLQSIELIDHIQKYGQTFYKKN